MNYCAHLSKLILCIAILVPCWSFLKTRRMSGGVCSNVACSSQLQLLPFFSTQLYFKENGIDISVKKPLETSSSLAPVTIQFADPQDLPSLVSLRVGAFFPENLNDLTFRETILEKVQRRIGKGSKFLLALRDSSRGKLPPSIQPEGSLYGTVEFNSFDFQNTSMENVGSNHKLYIGDLAVRQDARRLGIASSLLNFIEMYALQHGFDELYLHVEMFNEPARKLYRKNGFFEQPPTVSVRNFTEQLLSRPADSFSLMCKRLWIK